MNRLKVYIQSVAAYYQEHQFSIGFFFGCACVFLLVLIFVVFFVLPGRKSVKMIRITPLEKNPQTEFHVLASALNDYVKHFSRLYPFLKIKRVNLFSGKESLSMEIEANLISAKQINVPELLSTFSKDLLKSFEKNLGITNISRQKVKIANLDIDYDENPAVSQR